MTKKFCMLLLGACATFGFSACEKLLDIKPPVNELPSVLVFGSDATARAALSGAYSTTVNNLAFANSITLNGALSADEVVSLARTNLDYLTTNQLDPVLSLQATSLWNDYYACVYRFNEVV